jgi:hypothetical protein
MTVGRRLQLVALLCVIGVLLSGCSAASVRDVIRSGPPAVLSADQRYAIYDAVVRDTYFKQGLDSSAPGGRHIYLVRSMLLGSEPSSRAGEDLPPSVQKALSESLSDLGATIVWVDTLDEVPREPETGIVLDGVAISLGAIVSVSGNTAHVPTSYYIANLGAGGWTAVVRLIDGAWKGVGHTGSEWVS